MKKMRLAALLVAGALTMAMPAVPVFAQGSDPAVTAAESSNEAAEEKETETEKAAETAGINATEDSEENEKATDEDSADAEAFDLELPEIPGMDTEFIGSLLEDLDPDTIGVLLKNPKLLARFLPDLHVTVTETSVTIEIAGAEAKPDDAKQTGTVVTNGGNLNVRTGPSIDYEAISQLANGTKIEVIKEDNGWYQIVFPAEYAYVCGQYVKLNEVKTEETKEGYSFDISSETLAEFLSSFSGLFEEDTTQTQTSGSESGLTPDGNLTLVDDIGEKTGEGQQFITLVTKAGNYFYLIIDRDEKGEETVHFLNLVDEQDLFSLMEDDQKTAYQDQLAAEQAQKEAEEAAAAASTSASEESDKDKEPATAEKTKSKAALLLIIPLILAAAGGGWFYLQTRKKKTGTPAEDPDAGYLDEDDDEEDYGAGDEGSGKTRCPYEDEILGDHEDAAELEDGDADSDETEEE